MSDPTYQVKLVVDGRTVALGSVEVAHPSHHHLVPFLSMVVRAGVKRGDLVLVEPVTKRIVARRPVKVPGFHQSGDQPARTRAGRARKVLRTPPERLTSPDADAT